MGTERRDKLRRKSDSGLIFKQHADPAAELDDQARHHRPGKLDLDELNTLTLGTLQAARLLWSGWNPWHPANLPAAADLDHGVNFTTLTFHGYRELEEQTSVEFYFANPYHSWERGTNAPSEARRRAEGAPGG